MKLFEENYQCTGEGFRVSQRYLVLLATGFIVIFAGPVILMFAAFILDGSINVGAGTFIGLFPIVLGAGPEATWLVLFAMILAILSIVMFVVLRREAKAVKA